MCLSPQSACLRRDLHEKTKTCFQGIVLPLAPSLDTHTHTHTQTHIHTHTSHAECERGGRKSWLSGTSPCGTLHFTTAKILCKAPIRETTDSPILRVFNAGEDTCVWVVQVCDTGHRSVLAATSRNFRVLRCTSLENCFRQGSDCFFVSLPRWGTRILSSFCILFCARGFVSDFEKSFSTENWELLNVREMNLSVNGWVIKGSMTGL